MELRASFLSFARNNMLLCLQAHYHKLEGIGISRQTLASAHFANPSSWYTFQHNAMPSRDLSFLLQKSKLMKYTIPLRTMTNRIMSRLEQRTLNHSNSSQSFTSANRIVRLSRCQIRMEKRAFIALSQSERSLLTGSSWSLSRSKTGM